MAFKMYIYRADYYIDGKHRIRFFYARNTKVAKEVCSKILVEDGKKPERLEFIKLGYMYNDVGDPDFAQMEPEQETLLAMQNYGAGKKYAEREVIL